MNLFRKYILQSNIDNTILEVNEKVINSSILLKNITELTNTSPDIPINVDCSGNCLNNFVEVIQIQEEYGDDEKIYNSKIVELFKDFDDNALSDFTQKSCILDSDILLDALADIIIDKINDMPQREINKYLSIEDDFEDAERQWQNKNMLEYFISLNDTSFPLQFPIPCFQNNFYSMKTKFSSPLNILLSRICQRSDDSLAFRLSLCSKPLKNECDRYPIKVSRFFMQLFSWSLEIEKENISWLISMKAKNDKYFSAICKRRIMAWNDNIILNYGNITFWEDLFNIFKRFSFSLEWMIPHKNIKKIEVNFISFEIFISNFDLTKFSFSNVFFNLQFKKEIDFNFIYNHLIAKDLSKEVRLRFDFSQNFNIRISKKSQAAKFFDCYCCIRNKNELFSPKFKAFLTKYMEHDGHIAFLDPPAILPEQMFHICSIEPHQKYCLIYDILKYF